MLGGEGGAGRGDSEGSELGIRYLKGSKLPGCNFHSQIYDLASRGLNDAETSRLAAPAEGCCKSAPPCPA